MLPHQAGKQANDEISSCPGLSMRHSHSSEWAPSYDFHFALFVYFRDLLRQQERHVKNSHRHFGSVDIDIWDVRRPNNSLSLLVPFATVLITHRLFLSSVIRLCKRLESAVQFQLQQLALTPLLLQALRLGQGVHSGDDHGTYSDHVFQPIQQECYRQEAH